jgi:hypothetical protein
VIWAVAFGVAVVVLAAVLLLVAWLTGRQPDLAEVAIVGEHLVVRPRGLAKISAFRRKLVFERTAIRHVAVVDRTGIPRLGLKLRGTGTPNLQAGMFASDNQTGVVFLLVGRGQRLLRIDLARGQIRYLVLQVADPDQTAATLMAPGLR